MLSHERCRDTLQSHNNREEGSKKLAKTELKPLDPSEHLDPSMTPQ